MSEPRTPHPYRSALSRMPSVERAVSEHVTALNAIAQNIERTTESTMLLSPNVRAALRLRVEELRALGTALVSVLRTES